MATSVAVWIDHARAMVIEFAPGAEPAVRTIESDAELLTRSTGHIKNLPPGHGTGGVAHGHAERRHDQQLDRFYDHVASILRGAERIVILGPGQARDELARVLRQTPASAKALHAVEPADTHLTQAQIVDRARAMLLQ